jgi:hypothetical protein
MHDGQQVIPQQMQRLVGSSSCLQMEDDPAMGWWRTETASFGQDVQLSVMEDGEVHFLVFPCRRTKDGWLHSLTNKPVPSARAIGGIGRRFAAGIVKRAARERELPYLA